MKQQPAPGENWSPASSLNPTGITHKCGEETHPLYLVALLQGLTKLVHVLVGQGTLSLEPHALHLIQVLHCRRTLLEEHTFTVRK